MSGAGGSLPERKVGVGQGEQPDGQARPLSLRASRTMRVSTSRMQADLSHSILFKKNSPKVTNFQISSKSESMTLFPGSALITGAASGTILSLKTLLLISPILTLTKIPRNRPPSRHLLRNRRLSKNSHLRPKRDRSHRNALSDPFQLRKCAG